MNAQHYVLIIEDDPFHRALYTSKLKELGSDIRVLSSENGYAALVALSERTPDLIILDLRMPKFDGVAFLDVVKSKPEYDTLPVLVISSAPGDFARVRSAYKNVFMFAKPVRAELFERAVRWGLRLGEPPRAPSTTVESQHSLVDFEHMKLYIGPDRTIQQAVADEFYKLAADRISSLDRLAHNGDLRGVLDFCHAMEGGAEAIGAHEVLGTIESLRAAARAGDDEAVRGHARDFAEVLRRFCVDLAREFSLDAH